MKNIIIVCASGADMAILPEFCTDHTKLVNVLNTYKVLKDTDSVLCAERLEYIVDELLREWQK